MITRRNLLKSLGTFGAVGTVGVPGMLLSQNAEAAVTPFTRPINIDQISMRSTTLKRLIVSSLTVAVCGIGQGVFADTEFRDEGTAGQPIFTAITIAHGCNAPGAVAKAVIAQGVVFPFGMSDGSDGGLTANSEGTAVDLTQYLDTAQPKLFTVSPNMIQDKNIFDKQMEVTNALGRVVAIQYTHGELDKTAVGVLPVRATGPDLADGETNADGSTEPESCIKSLNVLIPIANWCSKTANVNDDTRVDLWMGHMTPLFNDPGVMPSQPEWPTLVINRATPLPAACGGGIVVEVEPTNAFIDAYLPIKGYWPTP